MKYGDGLQGKARGNPAAYGSGVTPNRTGSAVLRRGRRCTPPALIAAAAFGLAACGGGGDNTSPAGSVQGAAAARIVIPSADRFSPFVTMTRRGSLITFQNQDHDAHSVVSVPGDPTSFSKVLQPGETWTITLATSGAYHYYCSVHARYDASTGQVAALPGSDHPSEPMEGLVIVSS